MPGPGLYVLLAVVGVVLVVVARSRRQELPERVHPQDDPDEAGGHADPWPHGWPIGMDAQSYVDRHHRWTNGR